MATIEATRLRLPTGADVIGKRLHEPDVHAVPSPYLDGCLPDAHRVLCDPLSPAHMTAGPRTPTELLTLARSSAARYCPRLRPTAPQAWATCRDRARGWLVP